MKLPELLYNLKKHCIEHNLIIPNEHYLLALSAGPDSIFLLNFLQHILPKENLTCLYCDHGLRDTTEDHQILDQLKTAVIKQTLDVKTHAKTQNCSQETAARILRYQALIQVAERQNITNILTAHHQDDLCETLLMKLIRGTASAHPAITERQKLTSKTTLIRPLLSLKKSQVLDYLSQEKIPYATDKTNAETRLTRNKIRHKLIPIIEDINPNYQDAFQNFTQAGEERLRFENSIIETLLTHAKDNTYPRNELLKCHPYIQKKLIQRLAISNSKNNETIGKVHIDAIQKNSISPGKSIDIPGGKCIIEKNDIIFLS